MSAELLFIPADWVHAALEWRALVDALRDAFRVGTSAPLRASHPVTPAGDRLLLMPAWDSASLGVKIVTVFPRNLAQGLASVSALYLLLDGATGHPLALIDGDALTKRRTAAASALASIYLSRPDSRRLLVVGAGGLRGPADREGPRVGPNREAHRGDGCAAELGWDRRAGLQRSRRRARDLRHRDLRDDRPRADRARAPRPSRNARRPRRRFHRRNARERRRAGAACRGVCRHVRRCAEGGGRPRAADEQ